MHSLGDTMIPLKWKLRPPLGHFRFPLPLNQKTGERSYCAHWGDCSDPSGQSTTPDGSQEGLFGIEQVP